MATNNSGFTVYHAPAGETTRKTRHEKSRNGRYQGRNCSGAGSTSQRRRRRARVAPRVSRSAHRTLKGETVGTFDRPAGGSRVSSRRVPRARDRPGRQLFAVLRAISVITRFSSSENDARALTRLRATPKLGESEFRGGFIRISLVSTGSTHPFRPHSTLLTSTLSPSRLLAEVFSETPIVT